MIDQVSPQALAAWGQSMQGHGRPLLLDVREPWELQVASVTADGFELLALPMHSIPPRLAELDPARPVACLCHHGRRSLQVAAFLVHHGFAHVANVAGGIDAWSMDLDATVPRY